MPNNLDICELQWGRDKNVSEIRFQNTKGNDSSARFNGAETKMSRKFATTFAIWESVKPGFNGAETKMSRKSCVMPRSLLRQRKLQWGRDKNVSEIYWASYSPIKVARFNGAETKMSRKYIKGAWVVNRSRASMGPRQKCLGNLRSNRIILILPVASMGPRQKCLGNSGA